MTEQPIIKEKEQVISKEGESLKITLVFSVERESMNDLSIRRLWFEQEYVFEITDSRKCQLLRKNSYPFDRTIKQVDGTFKSKTFWGYKIFHTFNDVTQQIDCGISEDSAHGFGIKVTSSKPKRIKSNERLQSLLEHCESTYGVFEGIFGEGSTKRF